MRARALPLLLALGLVPALAERAAADGGAALEAGKKVYEQHCIQCHGEKGDGQGPAAVHLQPRPRDFTSGKFKLRTTPSGALPTDDDLKRVVRMGMPYTSSSFASEPNCWTRCWITDSSCCWTSSSVTVTLSSMAFARINFSLIIDCSTCSFRPGVLGSSLLLKM